MEFSLIESLKIRVGLDSRIHLGIGDDAAIIRPTSGHEILITTDMLLDGVHFLTAEHPLQWIARKCLAVNVSDIAAMGGAPLAAFLSVALPRSWTYSQAEALFQAFAVSASEFQVHIAGGDTTSWNAPLAVNIALYGEVPLGKALRRDAAKIGDIVCVSGALGGSLAGRQFTFQPRVGEARWLREHAQVHAMIDISDGLISDLNHILRASGVAAEIETARVPIAPDARTPGDQRSPPEHALTDGEDFELLWTMPELELNRVRNLPECPVAFHVIGRITEGEGCRLMDEHGRTVHCNTTGYVHRLQQDSSNP